MPPLGRRLGVVAALVATMCGGVGDGFADDGVTVAVDDTVCQGLINYQQPPGVAYQPGIDVQGRPVAPADLSPPLTLQAPTQFRSRITVDLARAYGLDATLHPELKVPVAEVVFRDGQVIVNGQILGSADTARVRQACAELTGRAKR